MERLLIAANSQAFAEAVSDCLSCRFEVAVCHTGQDALQYLREFRPDVFAVDLMLAGIDGIAVLKIAQSLGITGKVVAFSTYISDYVTAALDQLNVTCLVRMPCDQHQAAARILDVAQWQSQQPTLDSELRSILAVLGFRINHSGCLVTEACALQYLEDPKQRLVGQLYPAVALSLGGTGTQVEKAMSRAIDAAWQNRDEQIWKMYFPTEKNGTVARPTNAQFLAVIARCLAPWVDQKNKKAIG